MRRRHWFEISLIATTLSGMLMATGALAQVVVNGGNVSVDTGEGNVVRVENGKVSVKTGKDGQAAVAVGSGQRAVNVGSGNVAVNERGTIDGKPLPQTRKSGKSRTRQKADDEAFWGEGGFWGEEGEPGNTQSASRRGGKGGKSPNPSR